MNVRRIDNLKNYQAIKRQVAAFAYKIKNKEINLEDFYNSHIKRHLEPDEEYSFTRFKKHIDGRLPLYLFEIDDDKALIESEQRKEVNQILVRQGITEVMKDYASLVTSLVSQAKDDPGVLKKYGISVPQLYKLIREEEDRAKEIKLKEMSENRANQQWAFFLSLVKTGQMSPADIEFLEEDTKKELLVFKEQNGEFYLPTSGSIPRNDPPAETPPLIPGEGSPEGSV